MTVCVAALCVGDIIFGASDRVLTAGEILEYEPPTPKIVPITNSIAIMTAGDSALQTEILSELNISVREHIEREPNDWLHVKDLAYRYRHIRNEIRYRHAEEAILIPLSLTRETFLSRQNELSADFVSDIRRQLINFEMPGVEAIIAGIDPEGIRNRPGGHIYTVRDGNVTCHDSLGFAAVGVGSWHASSQFMLAGYSVSFYLAETLLLTYIAKKRAEVAPGVGKATDLFTIGTKLGSYRYLKNDFAALCGKLEKIYEQLVHKEGKTMASASREMATYYGAVSTITRTGSAVSDNSSCSN